jgi:hypothetical protein
LRSPLAARSPRKPLWRKIIAEPRNSRWPARLTSGGSALRKSPTSDASSPVCGRIPRSSRMVAARCSLVHRPKFHADVRCLPRAGACRRPTMMMTGRTGLTPAPLLPRHLCTNVKSKAPRRTSAERPDRWSAFSSHQNSFPDRQPSRVRRYRAQRRLSPARVTRSL